MTKQNFDINKLRVASPCSVSWETMSGDERVRRCHSCELNIYNISEMTKNEVENLIANREGRLCIRLYKRTDGTVLTKDCPVGLRAFYKRTTRFAGAALAAILGLFSVSFGQKGDKKAVDASKITIFRTTEINQPISLEGDVKDGRGALIPDVEIKLINQTSKEKFKTKTSEYGLYSFKSLPTGFYTIEFRSKFKPFKIKNLEVKTGEKIYMVINLEYREKSFWVGTYGEEPLIDLTSSSLKTTINQQTIDKLPH